MKPETRARISTVSTAVNRPVYSSHSVIIFSSGCDTVTGGGGGDALPPTDLPSQGARIAARSIAKATRGVVLVIDHLAFIGDWPCCVRNAPIILRPRTRLRQAHYSLSRGEPL